jgi:hypothetical protein
MTYLKLYNFIQEEPIYISRKVIRNKAQSLTGQEFRIVATGGLDSDICRGYFLSAKNSDSKLVQQCGGRNVIVLSRVLNDCWMRFVTVKEMMHIFGRKEQKVSTPQEFINLIEGMCGLEGKDSPQIQSEWECVWMALGVLCPEKERLNFKKLRKENKIDDYNIALKLKIPQLLVTTLLNDNFEENINKLKY